MLLFINKLFAPFFRNNCANEVNKVHKTRSNIEEVFVFMTNPLELS